MVQEANSMNAESVLNISRALAKAYSWITESPDSSLLSIPASQFPARSLEKFCQSVRTEKACRVAVTSHQSPPVQ